MQPTLYGVLRPEAMRISDGDDPSREHWTRIFYQLLSIRDHPTRNKGRRASADQKRPCSRNEKTLNRHIGRSERPSAPMPEHWKYKTVIGDRAGIFQAIRADYIPSSARTETGTERKQGHQADAYSRRP